MQARPLHNDRLIEFVLSLLETLITGTVSHFVVSAVRFLLLFEGLCHRIVQSIHLLILFCVASLERHCIISQSVDNISWL